jgi:hypothetical protein
VGRQAHVKAQPSTSDASPNASETGSRRHARPAGAVACGSHDAPGTPPGTGPVRSRTRQSAGRGTANLVYLYTLGERLWGGVSNAATSRPGICRHTGIPSPERSRSTIETHVRAWAT